MSENLEDLLFIVVEEFYSRVFGVKFSPVIEISPFLNYLIYYRINSKTIVIPFNYLSQLKSDLKDKRLDEIVSFLSELFHETVHYAFDINKSDIEKYGIFTIEGLAEVLYLFYSHLGKEIKIEDGSTLDSLLFLINDKVIKGFLDKEKLKEIEKRIIENLTSYMSYVTALLNRVNRRKLLEELNEVYFKGMMENISLGLIYYMPAYLIIKEFGIEEYMKDLRDVILNPERKNEILEKYHRVIKNNYENIFLNSSAVSSGGLDITNSP